jgi:hypothetical protein
MPADRVGTSLSSAPNVLRSCGRRTSAPRRHAAGTGGQPGRANSPFGRAMDLPSKDAIFVPQRAASERHDNAMGELLGGTAPHRGGRPTSGARALLCRARPRPTTRRDTTIGADHRMRRLIGPHQTDGRVVLNAYLKSRSSCRRQIPSLHAAPVLGLVDNPTEPPTLLCSQGEWPCPPPRGSLRGWPPVPRDALARRARPCPQQPLPRNRMEVLSLARSSSTLHMFLVIAQSVDVLAIGRSSHARTPARPVA